MISLFHAQSYEDSWSDYKRSLTNPGFAHWDYIIKTPGMTTSDCSRTPAFPFGTIILTAFRELMCDITLLSHFVSERAAGIHKGSVSKILGKIWL